MPIRFLILKRRHLALLCAALVSAAVFTAVSLAPAAVSAAAAQRQLPIYCVERDQKVCSISFDAAWAGVSVRQARSRQPREFAAPSADALDFAEGISYNQAIVEKR